MVDDAIESGFNAAGQRCSALRILAIQEEVYEKTAKMLIGATKKIKIGLPNLIDTDIPEEKVRGFVKKHKSTFDMLADEFIKKIKNFEK